MNIEKKEKLINELIRLTKSINIKLDKELLEIQQVKQLESAVSTCKNIIKLRNDNDKMVAGFEDLLRSTLSNAYSKNYRNKQIKEWAQKGVSQVALAEIFKMTPANINIIINN